jgi:CubicO group peptidase (beta-lactamase class C family)
MKNMTKIIFFTFLTLALLIHVAIIFSGKQYLYKAVAQTYLKGRSGPTIDEYAAFPNRNIHVSNPQPWNIASNYNKKKLSARFDSIFKHYQNVSFLVIQNDSIVFERYDNEWDETKISNSFSMAKSILGALTGIAIKEGKIQSVNQKVSDFIPEFRNDARHAITIKHLLTMTSGIAFDEDYVSPFAYPAQAYYGDDIRPLTLQYLQGKTPGTNYKYLSGDSQLLAFVLQQATGMNISDYAAVKLWKYLGAETDALWNLDHKNGFEKGFCCFHATARDFARLGKLYLQKGNFAGIQLIDTAFINESITSIAPIKNERNEVVDYYGYKWWLNQYKNYQIFYMRGILGQYVICIPEKNAIIVRLGYKRDKETDDHAPLDFYHYIDAALTLID